MPNFVVAEKADHDLLSKVVKKTFPHLDEANVTIGLLLAMSKDEGGGPVLKHHGYPALAVIKINSLKCRVEGKPDCTITLDGEQWPDHSDARKRALLDHELTHVELVKDKFGKLKHDDAGRPKLRLRLHDFQLGGFFETMERHGGEAVETNAYADLHRKLVQLNLFPAE